jgi:pimeloyl-ACP methyl ester carboxylesterase
MRALSERWQCRAYGIWSRQDVLYAHQFDALTARVQDLGLAAHRFIDRGGHWLLYENAEEANQFLLQCLNHD